MAKVIWGIVAGSCMTETENFGHDFSTRKRAFEKHRRAQEAVKKAAEAREKAAILWHMQLEVEVIRIGHSYRSLV